MVYVWVFLIPFSRRHVLEELLVWIGNVLVIRKVFADDIKISEMLVENLEDIRSYVLLHVKYAYIYAYVIAHVCYFWYYVQLFWFSGLGIIH